MMLERGERDTSIESQVNRIRGIIGKKNSMLFVVQSESKLIGYLSDIGGQYQRNAHKIDIVIGVLQEYSGKGLGTCLLKKMEELARKAGLNRLELTVIKHNETASALYKKAGFTIEG